MSQKIKNIIIGTTLLVVIVAGYSFFFKKNDNRNLLVSETATNVRGEASVVREFLLLLETLNNLRLDTAIFSDRVFKSLRDESVALPHEPSGRKNPFAPLK